MIGHLVNFLFIICNCFVSLCNESLGVDVSAIAIQNAQNMGVNQKELAFLDSFCEKALSIPRGHFEDSEDFEQPDCICFRDGLKHVFVTLNQAWFEFDTKVFNKCLWDFVNSIEGPQQGIRCFPDTCHCNAKEFVSVLVQFFKWVTGITDELAPAFHKSSFVETHEEKCNGPSSGEFVASSQ